MSTIDYKEKYEQALKDAQRFYNNNVAITKKGIEDIFPELKESDDERIRKEIMELVMQPTWKTEKEFHRRNELCTWLEKQGSQILANSAKTCNDKQKPEIDQHSLPVSDDSSLPTFDESIYHPCTEKAYEQKSSEWSEEDKKMISSIIINLKRVENDYHIDLTKQMEWLRNIVKKGKEV